MSKSEAVTEPVAASSFVEPAPSIPRILAELAASVSHLTNTVAILENNLQAGGVLSQKTCDEYHTQRRCFGTGIASGLAQNLHDLLQRTRAISASVESINKRVDA